MLNLCDKPLAAPGLISYRYPKPSGYGYIMIGATDDADALNEAQRSLSYTTPVMANLEVWSDTKYVPVKG